MTLNRKNSMSGERYLRLACLAGFAFALASQAQEHGKANRFQYFLKKARRFAHLSWLATGMRRPRPLSLSDIDPRRNPNLN